MEPKWYTQLAEWSANPPSVREFKRASKDEGVRIWLCEIFHAVNKYERKIDELEARIAALERRT